LKHLNKISFLIIAVSVGYYFMWYVPRKENLETESRQSAKNDLTICYEWAHTEYQKSWSEMCKSLSRYHEIKRHECSATLMSLSTNPQTQYMAQSLCFSKWPQIENNPNCELFNPHAQELNTYLENMKNECQRVYAINSK